MAQGGNTGGNFLTNLPGFIRQVRAETAKVTWPTRAETFRTGVMVVILTTFLALFFFAIDGVFSRVVRFLLSLAG